MFRWLANFILVFIDILHLERKARAMKPDVIIETRNLTKVYRDFWGRPKVKAAQSA